MSNMWSSALIGVLGLTQIAAGAPGAPATSTKQCVELRVPVPVVALNHHYIMPRVDSNIDAIDWTVNVTTWSNPTAAERVTGDVSVDRTFNINAQLCVPSQKGAKADILQIATHGLGFDKRYFDVEVKPAEYSYVNAAVKKGYSILTYDRLGTGKSEKPDAYDLVQIPTEIEILAGLTKLARSGKLISSSKILSTSSNTTIPDVKPSKVVHVGHSFGSFLVALMLSKYGTLSDGAILSSFLLTKLPMIDVLHYDHDFARQHDPVRFAEYGSGYFVLNTESCLQKLFFRKGAFEPELLSYTNKIKQPEAVGTYASEGTSSFAPAAQFKGPIQLFNGEFDNFICNGDCRGVYDKETTEFLFPGSKITPYLQPNTGHALNVATNASAGYQVMLQYLDSNGL
ncbi:hypothetical protein C8A01DRAFT_41389 [Parachaetomium inaequale]|uniref:AB hydrolase-1 domain-containing protein n=1 Tax=Parachaetomium inaequale TaxID=2588326 RepID=A0AAN6P5J8_9PEZI|nr:hypothetical protein C8A01DRAFT_41389 [Parachaetomium inaequale]